MSEQTVSKFDLRSQDGVLAANEEIAHQSMNQRLPVANLRIAERCALSPIRLARVCMSYQRLIYHATGRREVKTIPLLEKV